MIANEKKRQVSTPVVVAKDNLKKQTEAKGYPLQNKKQHTHTQKRKIINTYLKQFTHATDR